MINNDRQLILNFGVGREIVLDSEQLHGGLLVPRQRVDVLAFVQNLGQGLVVVAQNRFVATQLKNLTYFRILLQFQLKWKIRRHVFLPTTIMEGDIFLTNNSSDHIFKNNLPCSECALFSFGTQQTPKNWCCKFKF